jgi:hypothetical protein
LATQDVFDQRQREVAEQQAANDRGRRQNVEMFTTMFLGLGADVIKLAGSRHDEELAEAKALAASRWDRL